MSCEDIVSVLNTETWSSMEDESESDFDYETLTTTNETAESGPSYYECDFCGLKLIDRSAIEKHMEIHKRFEGFQCRTCLKVFENESYLFDHLLSDDSHINLDNDKNRRVLCTV